MPPPTSALQLHNTALMSLDLSDLNMPCFPPQLSRLSGLTALNLAHNQIKELPEVRGQFLLIGQYLLQMPSRLHRSTALARNQIMELPEVRGQFLFLGQYLL